MTAGIVRDTKTNTYVKFGCFRHWVIAEINGLRGFLLIKKFSFPYSANWRVR